MRKDELQIVSRVDGDLRAQDRVRVRVAAHSAAKLEHNRKGGAPTLTPHPNSVSMQIMERTLVITKDGHDACDLILDWP